MLCNAHDDMSNFSIRSKHQRCYKAKKQQSIYLGNKPGKQGKPLPSVEIRSLRGGKQSTQTTLVPLDKT